MQPADRIDPNTIRWQSAPAQEREVRGEEADIGQSQASAASSAASAQRTQALLSSDVRRGEVEAEKAAIDLADSQRALEQARRRGEFTQSLATPEAQRVLSDIARARRLIQSGMGTGAAAFLSVNAPGTPASELWGEGGLRDSITSEGVMDALMSSREGSAQGATPFGQLAIREMELVRSRQGSFAYGNSAEQNLRALDQMEQAYRRAFAFDMGIDWRTEEGARFVGLPYNPDIDPLRNPRGAAGYDAEVVGGEEGAPFSYILPPGLEDSATPPPSSGGPLERGEWVSNPELRGVDAAVTGLIEQGVAQNRPSGDIEADIRTYLDSVQPGLGARATGVSENIRYHRDTGRDPGVLIEREYVSEGERPGAFTAYATGVSDVLTGGFLDELTGKGAEMRALEAEQPGAYLTGQMTGGLLTGLTGAAGAARAGVNVPWYLQGAGANTIYGAGSADEDNRLAGAGLGLVTTPFGNIAGQATGRALGSLIGGTTDEGARTLAQRYGVEMTPGNVSPGGAMSWLEGRLSDLPVTQGVVGRRGDEAVQSFNEAAFNRALEPIGGTTQGVIGREGVEAANQLVDQAYRDALDGVTISVDPARVFDDSWLQGITGPAADSARRQIATMRNNLVSPNNTMTGAQVQEAKQSMQALRQSLANAEGIEPAVVRRVDNLQDELYDAFEAQAPENFARFRAADQAFGNMQTVQNAVLMAPGSRIDAETGRTFLPSGLGVQARQGDIRYRGRRAAAEGEGTFAELADLGEIYIQPRGPGSMRSALATGTAVGLPAAAYMLAPGPSGGEEGEAAAPSGPSGLPAGLAYGLPVAALAALPFTRGGSRLYGRMMTADRPSYARELGGLLTRYGGPAAGSALSRPAIDLFASPVYPEAIAPGDITALAEQYSGRLPAAPEAEQRPAVDPTAPSTAQTGELRMGDRRIRYDPATDDYVDLDTGQRAKDMQDFGMYARGGRVQPRKRRAMTHTLKG